MNYSNIKSFIRETSNFSSNILTDSTSRLSFSEIKNIKLFQNSIKTKNKSRNNKSTTPKIHLKKTNSNNNNSDIYENNNFLYSFSRNKKISKTNTENNYTLSKAYSNILNNSKITNIKQIFYKIYPQRKDSLIDFKEQTRNIRLLKIDTYNGRKALKEMKEKMIYNEAKTGHFEFSKNEDKKMMNIFKDNLNSYLTYLKRKEIKENMTNENLIEQKNMLIKKIMSMGNRVNRLLKLFEFLLECKSFLLCIKECSIDFNKFSKDSQLEMLYDLFKLFNYESGYYIMNNFENINQFQNWLIKRKKMLTENDTSKKYMYFNYITTSIDMNNFLKVFKDINNDYIKNHKAKKIFESPKEFDETLLNDQAQVRISLDKFVISNDKLNQLKNELIYELRRKDKIKEIFNLTKDKYYLLLDRLDISKTNFLNNSSDKKNYSKYKIKIVSKKINDKINAIINKIMKLDSNDIKKIKFERTNKYIITTIDKIRYIEKIMNYFMQYKETQKYINEKNYEIVMKEFKEEQFIRRFKNREETMKKIQELKIKKILEKKYRILFLPHKK
jgi:hypothetical protein